jgi:hypothetical protein
VPHVIGVQSGQTLRIRSSDGQGTLHNVKYAPQKNPAANFGLTPDTFAGKTVDELFAPDVATKLLLSNQTYDDIFPRLTGAVLIGELLGGQCQLV